MPLGELLYVHVIEVLQYINQGYKVFVAALREAMFGNNYSTCK